MKSFRVVGASLELDGSPQPSRCAGEGKELRPGTGTRDPGASGSQVPAVLVVPSGSDAFEQGGDDRRRDRHHPTGLRKSPQWSIPT